MKNIILSISSIAISIACLCLVCVLLKQHVNSTELATNVGDAVKYTLKEEIEAQKAASREEFLAGFMERMAISLKTDSKVQISVWNAREEEGLLGIEVVEMFRYPNGKEGKRKSSRFAILEPQVKKRENHTVKFYLNRDDEVSVGECYKSYVVSDGEKISEPKVPLLEGKEFAGWVDANNYVADFSQMVCEDIVYYGEWKDE